MDNNIVKGKISTNDCTCEPGETICMCEDAEWELWEEYVEPFFNSSEHFFYRKGDTCEITDLRQFSRRSRLTREWSKAYGFMQDLLDRCSQYTVHWSIKDNKLNVQINALHVEIISCTQTNCAVCGNDGFVKEEPIMKQLAWYHPTIYAEPVYHNGVPFCQSCAKYYTDKYVIISGDTHIAVNMTDEEIEADMYYTGEQLFTKDGKTPSPEYTLNSVGKMWTICRRTSIDTIVWQ
jgi:hypothetical protein